MLICKRKLLINFPTYKNNILNLKQNKMKNSNQVRELNTKLLFSAKLLSVFMFLLSFSSIAQEQVTMSLEWLGSTPTTADFQVRLTNTGALPVKFNSIIIRGKHAEKIVTDGASISFKALNTNTNSEWNNWPNFTNTLAYREDKNMLNYSSNVKYFSPETSPVIPTGEGVIIGSYRITVAGGTWLPNSDFAFNFDPTTAVIAYVPSLQSTTISLSDNPAISNSNTACGNCLVKTVSASQLLNTTSLTTSPTNFNVYPNPTNGKFDINLPLNTKANVSIVDADGKLIIEKNNLSNGSQMNLGNVAPGVYLVNITTDNEVQTIRLVKN